MTKLLFKFADLADALVDRVGLFAAWIAFAMVLLISGNTLARYFFNASTVWLQELEWHLLALVALWGIARMQLRATPVRVDLFYQSYRERTKLWIEFFTALLVMLPFSLFVCWLGWSFVRHSWSLAEVSPGPGACPALGGEVAGGVRLRPVGADGGEHSDPHRGTARRTRGGSTPWRLKSCRC